MFPSNGTECGDGVLQYGQGASYGPHHDEIPSAVLLLSEE